MTSEFVSMSYADEWAVRRQVAFTFKAMLVAPKEVGDFEYDLVEDKLIEEFG